MTPPVINWFTFFDCGDSFAAFFSRQKESGEGIAAVQNTTSNPC
jgi:hypothetical protein